jgi:hypothetical protein
VNSVNDNPVAVNDPVTTNEDNAVTFDVRANDSDVDGDSLSVTKINGTAISVGNPVAISGGSISLGADGQLTYTPTADFNGTPSFTYTISDGQGGTADATVNLTVTAVNDAPVATITPLTYSATEQTTLHLHGTGLSISDVDAGSGSMTVTLAVTEGVITIFTGSTGVGVSNSGTSSVTITGTVTQINDLLAGNGGATVNYFDGPNQFDGYDAPSASATLTMTVHDNGNTGGGDLSSSDTATINITAVNDAPVATIAHTYGVIEQQNLTLHGTGLSISDVDAGSGSMTVTLSVTEGVLNVAAGTSGALVSNSGTSSVTITGSQSQINDLLAGGHSATVVYNDNLDNPSSSVTLSLSVHDNGNTGGGDLSSTATTSITVAPVDDAPVATPVTLAAIAEDSGTRTITQAELLTGVTDVDNTAAQLSIASLTIASGTGTLVDNHNGTWSYTPALNDDTGVTFNYTASDGSLIASSTASLDITPVNDAPVNNVPGTQTIAEDGSRVFSTGNGNAISVSDLDVSSGNLTVTLSVAHGTLTLGTLAGLAFGTGDGTADATMTFTGTQAAVNAALQGLVYTATADFNGSDTLSITTSDNGNSGSGGALSDSDTTTVNITAVADIVADNVTVNQNSGANSLNLLANDTFENPGRFISAVSTASHGTVSINNNGTPGVLTDDFVVYTPNSGYSGTDSFTYTVTSGGVTETATVNVTVNAADTQSPTDIVFNLNSASGSFSGNGLGNGSVLGSFTAVDADSVSWTFTLGGTNASLFTLSPSGSQASVNIAAAGAIATGNYTFTVTATDGAGHSFTETYHVGVGSTGTDLAGAFTVTTGTDVDFGLNGQDVILGGAGDDALVGGQNSDQITGGIGADQLIGGQQGDLFIYTAVNESTVASHDTIFDFEEAGAGDQIDLHLIDANLGVANDQAFAFVAAQTNAVVNNSVTWFQDAAHNQTVIQADNNGDGIADVMIVLTGIHTLNSGDFVL